MIAGPIRVENPDIFARSIVIINTQKNTNYILLRLPSFTYGLPPSLLNQFLTMPRAAKAAGKMRHDPLHQQLDEDELHAKYGKISKPGKRTKSSLKWDNEKERDGVSMALLLYAKDIPN